MWKHSRNYFKIISQTYCSSQIFSNMFTVTKIILKQFYLSFRHGHMWNKTLKLFQNTFISHVTTGLATMPTTAVHYWMLTLTLTTSKVDEEIIFCKRNGLCHLFNQFEACFAIDLQHITRCKQVSVFSMVSLYQKSQSTVSCFPRKVSLQLSSELSIGDV